MDRYGSHYTRRPAQRNAMGLPHGLLRYILHMLESHAARHSAPRSSIDGKQTLTMLIQPYHIGELSFAYSSRVYMRWQTYRLKQIPALGKLDSTTLDSIAERFGIRILKTNSGDTDVLLLVSLKPEETVATCASKLKGQISKWLREQMGHSKAKNLLATG